MLAASWGLQITPDTEGVAQAGADDHRAEALKGDGALEVSRRQTAEHALPVNRPCSQIASVTLTHVEVPGSAQPHINSACSGTHCDCELMVNAIDHLLELITTELDGVFKVVLLDVHMVGVQVHAHV